MGRKISEIYSINYPNPQNESEISHTVEEAIEVIGVGKVQIFGIIASFMCLMNYALDVLGMSFIIPAATCELQLDTFKKGLLTSVPFLGLTLTSHLWGFLADSIGRRKSVAWSLGLTVLFSALAALAPSYWIMLVFRMLSGMGFSGVMSAMYPYIGEILTQRTRSNVLVVFGFGVGVGMLLTSANGFLIKEYGVSVPITESFSIAPWRIQMLIHLLPGLAALLIYMILPESPKFLMSIGERGKALEVLRTIHQKNCDGRREFPIKSLTEETSAVEHSSSLSAFLKSYIEETKILLKNPFKWPLLGCCFIQYGIFTIGAGFILWYPVITNKLGSSSNEGGSGRVCEMFVKPSIPFNDTISELPLDWNNCHVQVQDKMYLDNLVLGCGYIIANGIYSILNVRINLLYVWIGSVTLSCISGFILPGLTNEVAIMIFFSLFLLGSGASINIFNVIVVQIFPVRLCGMAFSLTLLIGRLSTFISTNVLGILLETHCEVTIYGVATLIALSIICGFYLPKEVIKGKL